MPRRHFTLGALTLFGVGLLPAVARAATGPGAVDMIPVLGGLALVLVGAKLGGEAFERFGMPAVLGELLVGVVLGNLGLFGVHALDGLRTLPALDLLAQLGVLFLLFEVGLESDVRKMATVGLSALVVATLGVIAPMVLGYYASAWFFPSAHPLTHWFVGATLSATSVGITARVLKDLGRSDSAEGRIILGAAVIDDVLGLIVLAVVVGVIQAADRGVAFQPSGVLIILAKSVAFLAGAVMVGSWLSRTVFKVAARMRIGGVLVTLAIAFCFLLSFLAGVSGLAPIVGAFAAGLVLDGTHYADLRGRDQRQRSIEELLQPVLAFLVPVFFVLMGARVDLSVFGAPGVLGFATVLTLAAVLGKQVCSLGVLTPGVDRIAIGLGMIPRGEVGLIFASIGASLTIGGVRVVDPAVYSAVVVMVALTTLLTPPLLVWKLRRA